MKIYTKPEIEVKQFSNADSILNLSNPQVNQSAFKTYDWQTKQLN